MNWTKIGYWRIKFPQLKEEGRKLLLLYYTHFKGFDGDDEDEIEGEKNASNKKVKTSTSYQGKKEEEEEHSNEAESTPPKVVKKAQVERIALAEKISVIGRPELQTGVLNKTNNNLPKKKRKELENPETRDGPPQKVLSYRIEFYIDKEHNLFYYSNLSPYEINESHFN